MKMRNDNIKAVVVGGYILDSSGQMVQLIGAYEEPAEAYGEAYLYLAEMAEGYGDDSKDYSITLPQELEGDTGYALYLKDKTGQIVDYACVLFNSNVKGDKDGK